MPDYAYSGETIKFTKNDIGPSAGDGKHVNEQSFAALIAKLTEDYIEEGGALPLTSASLSITVPALTGFISGYDVDLPSLSITVGASTTSYAFVKLDKDGDDNVTGASIEVNTTGTQPADSIALSVITSGASTITNTRDKAPRGRFGRLEPLVYMGLY